MPLPSAPDYDGAHLRHVLPSACAALGLEGFNNMLGVPESSIAVVILVDGLGDENLAAHTGYARFLASVWRRSAQAKVLDSPAPATTSVSLTCLGTGATPGEHGVTGYDVYSQRLDRVVNMLGGWDDEVEPASWQQRPSLLRGAVQQGAAVLTVSRPQFRSSALTQAALSGGEFRGADRIEHRFAAAADWISKQRSAAPGMRSGPAQPLLVYLYVDELDRAGHKRGVGDASWRNLLESVDESARRFSLGLQQRYGDQATVLVTADHGMVDVPDDARTDVSAEEDLMRGVKCTSGDPRMMYVHAAEGQSPEELATRWRARFEQQAWVLTRQEAVEADWFGPVHPEHLSRIGDVLVAMTGNSALFDISRTGSGPLGMVGMHGSLTTEERRVPLLELTGRAFSR